MSATSGPDVLGSPEAGPAAVRGGVLRVGAYLAGVVLTVGSAVLLFRHLGVVDGGRYVVVLSVVALFGGLTDAGLSTIGVRELSVHTAERRAAVFRDLLGLRLALTLVGAILACGWAVVAGYGATLVLGTALAGVGILLQNLQAAYATALTAELRLGWVAAADFLRQVVTVLGIVVLVVVGAELLPFFVVVPIAGLAAVAFTVATVRTVPLRPSFDVRRWRVLLRETLPFALAVAVGSMYYRIAILIVDLLASDRETGLFGASFRIIDVLLAVPQLVVGAAFPIFARAASDDLARLRYGLEKVMQACVILGIGTALLLFCGADFAMAVIGGRKFEDAVPVLQLQGLAMAASFVAAAIGYALVSLRLHREVLVSSLVALAACVGLTVPLTLADGARGAALATVLAEIVLLVVSGWLLTRAGAPVRWGQLRAPQVAAAGLAAGLLTLLGLPSVVTAVLAGLVFVVILLFLRAIPDELLEALARRR